MDEPIRILLAEDHPIVRRGLRDILREQADLQVVGEVDHGRDLEPAVEQDRPDILLLDLNMPDLDPAPVTRRLKQQYPDLHVLVLTAHDNVELVIGLLSAGAAGYVLKDEATGTLVDAIRTVAQGDNWFTQRVTQKLARKLEEPAAVGRDRLERLTPRESEILLLIGQGFENAEIARMLGISKRTVEAHARQIYAKLEVKGRLQAIRYALEHGLVDGDG